MNSIVRKISRFVKTLGRDERGEDLSSGSSALSRAGIVVITATAITAAAAGSASLATSANNNGETVSTKINGATGAQVEKADKVGSAFGNGGK